jgi:XRE family transcriptional regulator, fatty acid utilization regulator
MPTDNTCDTHEEKLVKKIIGRRIKEERNRQNLTQDELIRSAQLEWDRQTLGQVENGEREIKAWELARISAVLRLDMASFFPTVQEEVARPVVLWRQKPESPERLEAEFIRLCKDYKFVEDLNMSLSPAAFGFEKLRHREIDLQFFQYRDAYTLAEEIRRELGLGEYPAVALVKTLEEKYGLKLFFEGLDGNASAASSVSEYGYCIAINPDEPTWRQLFSIAHELFHIITWHDKLVEQITSNELFRERNERRANAFAAGLLIPLESLHREIQLRARENKLSEGALVAIACQFGVSLEALLWRMANERLIDKNTVKPTLEDERLQALDRENRSKSSQPPCFSNRFIRLAYLAYSNGEISRARLAKMLKRSLSSLSDYLHQFGLIEVGDNEITLSYT